jgi:hypothetical protein
MVWPVTGVVGLVLCATRGIASIASAELRKVILRVLFIFQFSP